MSGPELLAVMLITSASLTGAQSTKSFPIQISSALLGPFSHKLDTTTEFSWGTTMRLQGQQIFQIYLAGFPEFPQAHSLLMNLCYVYSGGSMC